MSAPLLGLEGAAAACICDHLAKACDQLGAAIATEHSKGADGDPHQLLEAFHTIWQLRWELGFTGGEVVAKVARDGRGGVS